ncbi:hypothetical protein [Shewanella pneumatophori]|uniref:Uncharacterized protein n=1 Tax=Shewanella pneumatophori TaxID=314092 RepID=A0A9X1ZJB1_9GAMM|nr:hypothetical protein [Shewanella pneumatophori]MCL1140865.1 hypothetical protein [Shewanella pneumatophori]
MFRLARFIHAFICSPAKLGRVLLIVILTMQSMVTMADDCTSAHDDCGSEVFFVAEHTSGTANNTSQCDDLETASHVEDDCAECSNNCCSCCMTLMHPVTAMQASTSNPNSFVLSFNFTSVEAPYYSLLRPPKAVLV